MELTISMIQLLIATIVVIGAGFTVWVNLNIEITKLKSKVEYLEDTDTEWKLLLTDIQLQLQQIKILLASNNLKEK
jgi:prefoldin subunit 5